MNGKKYGYWRYSLVNIIIAFLIWLVAYLVIMHLGPHAYTSHRDDHLLPANLIGFVLLSYDFPIHGVLRSRWETQFSLWRFLLLVWFLEILTTLLVIVSMLVYGFDTLLVSALIAGTMVVVNIGILWWFNH